MGRVSPLASKELFLEALKVCNSQTEILKFFGLRAAGGNAANLKKWAEIHNLELPIATGYQKLVAAHVKNLRPDDEVFIIDSTYSNRNQLKKRLRDIWSLWECALCGLGELWNGLPLVLQLDHINGKYNDHRLENLRLLCPNCHSQTETFSGKKSKK